MEEKEGNTIGIYKATIITDENFQTNNKLFVMFHTKNACKLEFADHLWLPFLDQKQLDVLVFVIISLHIYKNFVT